MQRNRETDHQICILHQLVSVFWFFKFRFTYDLGLGVLIVLDWIGMYRIAFRFWLRFSFE